MASTAKPKTPKTIIDRVLVAIETLESPGESSRQAIAKFLKERFDYENAPALKRALTKAVADGKLDQRGQSFAIPGLEFDEPEDEKVTIEVLDEGQFASSSGPRLRGGRPSHHRLRRSIERERLRVRSIERPVHVHARVRRGDRGHGARRARMKTDETRRVTVPPKLGYGKRGDPPDIPGDSTLVFDVTMLRFEPVMGE